MSSPERWAVGLRCSLTGAAGEPNDPAFLYRLRNFDRAQAKTSTVLERTVLFQTGHPANDQ